MLKLFSLSGSGARIALARVLVLVLVLGGARLAVAHADPAGPASAGACVDDPRLACASSVTDHVDARGTLWRVWSAGGTVSVATSTDQGRHFTRPVALGPRGRPLDTGPDNPPQIAVDERGRAVVAYSVFKDRQHNGELLLSTSGDGGKTFTAPQAPWPMAPSQRFGVLSASPGQGVFLAWMDKPAATAVGAEPTVSFAWSHDGGVTFSAPQVAATQACECCRLALSTDAEGWPWLMFRRVYEGHERDHAVLRLREGHSPVPPLRVSRDRWALQGCPHHGPALSVSGTATVHAAWFTRGQSRQGLFVARSDDAGQTFSPPMPVGEASRQAGRPAVLALGDRVWLAWKEFDGKTVSIRSRASDDGGRTWSTERLVFETTQTAAHPQLLPMLGRPFLSWMSREHGHSLVPLE